MLDIKKFFRLFVLYCCMQANLGSTFVEPLVDYTCRGEPFSCSLGARMLPKIMFACFRLYLEEAPRDFVFLIT